MKKKQFEKFEEKKTDLERREQLHFFLFLFEKDRTSFQGHDMRQSMCYVQSNKFLLLVSKNRRLSLERLSHIHTRIFDDSIRGRFSSMLSII